MFSSIDDVVEQFKKNNYIASRRIATVIYLAAGWETSPGRRTRRSRQDRPGEGSRGVARMAISFGSSATRGSTRARRSTNGSTPSSFSTRRSSRTRSAKCCVGTKGLAEAVDQHRGEDEVFFSERFVLPRPLLKAITSEKPAVLLIDEIDKADAEFEAFLLELLSDFQVTIPEIGTIKAKQIPLVVLTSNNAREMSDALKRRCLHLYIDFPSKEQELAIVQIKVPDAARSSRRKSSRWCSRCASSTSRRRRASARRWTGSRR